MTYRRFLLIAAFLLAPVLVTPTEAKPPPDKKQEVTSKIIDRISDVTVKIETGGSIGTGVVVVRDDTTYVWTDGHCVEAVRQVKRIVDPKTGKEYRKIVFGDVIVTKYDFEDGKVVAKRSYTAKVIRYSSSDEGRDDLALLRIDKKNVFKKSTEFYLEDKLPKLGQEIWHMGCFKGETGSFSLSDGIISHIGRIWNGIYFDQVSCTHFPGSSGGGVFRKSDGLCIGLIDRTNGETFGVATPIRRMKVWAEKVGVSFALDPKIAVPDEQTLLKYPVDDAAVEIPKDAFKTTDGQD